MEFTREQLVDFVRGLCSPDVEASIRTESDRRPELATQIQALKAVVSAAQFEKENEVPEMWALRAKALIPLLATSGRSWLAALVFDSRRQPAMGMRSTASSARDMRFESEWASVDLHLEEGGAISLTGVVQIPDEGNAAGLRIEAQRGTKTLVTVETNAFGEFDLEVASLEGLVLIAVDDESGNRLEIDLQLLDEQEK